MTETHRTHRPTPMSLAALAALAATTAAACGVTSKSLAVSPGTMGMAQITGGVDPNNSCAPPLPPAPQPAARWNAEPPANKVLVPVGFEIWRNGANGGACTEHKEVAYRGIFQYDLTTVIPVKQTVTKAVLTFSSKVLPSGVTPSASNLCDPSAGGLGSLFEVTAPVQMSTNLQEIASTTPPFPAGNKLVAFPIPWVPGAIGSQTTSTATGQGGAAFTVDVTPRIQAALAAGATSIQFMLSGSDEAFPRPIPPPASIDCRTLFEIRNLEVTFVGQ